MSKPAEDDALTAAHLKVHVAHPHERAVPFSELKRGQLFRFKDGLRVQMRLAGDMGTGTGTHIDVITGEARVTVDFDIKVEVATDALLTVAF